MSNPTSPPDSAEIWTRSAIVTLHTVVKKMFDNAAETLWTEGDRNARVSMGERTADFRWGPVLNNGVSSHFTVLIDPPRRLFVFEIQILDEAPERTSHVPPLTREQIANTLEAAILRSRRPSAKGN